MNRFFVPLSAISDDRAVITGQDVKHIGYSLRMAVGDKIYICDGAGFDYQCEILSITKTEVQVRILHKTQNTSEPKLKTTLFVALPKGDKMELIIEKSVELGVFCVRPFISAHCISRPDDKTLAKKTERWQAVAEAAAKQSGRGIVPEIYPCTSFENVIKFAADLDQCLLFYEAADQVVLNPSITNNNSLGIITGPEGGFSPKEIDFAKGVCKIATLGKRILRCETAPIAALAVISYFEYL